MNPRHKCWIHVNGEKVPGVARLDDTGKIVEYVPEFPDTAPKPKKQSKPATTAGKE